MHISPAHITRITRPHQLAEVLAHLRIIVPPGTTHPEEGLITRRYDAALQRIESRTRRFIGTSRIRFIFTGWDEELTTSWHVGGADDIQLTYRDTGGTDKQYTDISFCHDGTFRLGDPPDDRDDSIPCSLEFTVQPYVREDLNDMALALTAQWYENRGDQNIRGVPHWIESVCANHAWQSL